MSDQAKSAPADEGSVYTDRAIYFTADNAFKAKLPEVPKHIFLAERDRAFDPASGSGLIELDLGDVLECGYPATTPNMLARYARIEAGETLDFTVKACGEAYYVIEGAATIAKGDDRIACGAGDIATFPGGGGTTIEAHETSVLLMLTDEPALALHGAEPPAAGPTPLRAVHYPAAEIMRQLETHIASETEETRTGQAVLLTSAGIDRMQTATTTLTLAINSLEPGGDQLAHRHNATALTLALECDGVYSMIDGERVDWSKHAVMLTPPTALHAHHNRGDARMMSLVAQDGGLFYYARAIGFGFE